MESIKPFGSSSKVTYKKIDRAYIKSRERIDYDSISETVTIEEAEKASLIDTVFGIMKTQIAPNRESESMHINEILNRQGVALPNLIREKGLDCDPR